MKSDVVEDVDKAVTHNYKLMQIISSIMGHFYAKKKKKTGSNLTTLVAFVLRPLLTHPATLEQMEGRE